MEIITLEHDGRCKWLENKVLKGLLPKALKQARDPSSKKQYIIVDWISNDNGKVGVDLKWFKTLGMPAVQSYKDLPSGNDYSVINTGYDSIVEEESVLRARGVEIVDEPCPFIRRVRKLLENHDTAYQYILLCEPNHIIVKNFSSIFPEDMILVQMDNYQERIKQVANGKPLMLIPYVTFLPGHVRSIMEFLKTEFPGLECKKVDAHCMWIKSKASPIVEIDGLPQNMLDDVDAALLVTGPGTANKSLVSLFETLEKRGLPIVLITSVNEFIAYKKANENSKVLLVKSPIPNTTENDIEGYMKFGYLGVLIQRVTHNRFVRAYGIGAFNKLAYVVNWLRIKAAAWWPVKAGALNGDGARN